MSWIEEIDEDDAGDDLRKVLNKVKGDRGKIANIMKVHSLNPSIMEAHMDFYMDIMFRSSSLSRENCELVAVIVSKLNDCEYCVNHHKEALNYYWKDEERLKKLLNDINEADLSEKQVEMVSYAEKATLDPNSVSQEDFKDLQNAGLSDENIHDLVVIIGYFNFVNRIALGLGVEFSEDEVEGYDY